MQCCVYGPPLQCYLWGHAIPYDASDASSDRMAGTGSINREREREPRVR